MIESGLSQLLGGLIPYWREASTIVWQWPWMIVLLPLPFLARFVIPARSAEPDALRVPFFRTLESLNTEQKSHNSWRWLTALLCVLAWLFLLAAAARPTWIGDPIPLPHEGRDLMLAVDISQSMDERDMRFSNGWGSRIAAVKQVVGDFIQQRDADRLGLILFGERAYLQTPLTFDSETVQIQLNEAQLGFAGNATAIGDAIGVSVKRLRDRPAESRVLILLTDGANTAGTDPRAAAEIAAEANIRIHTIGVGAETRSGFGRLRGSGLDEETLSFIAEATGGEYFRARNPSELQSIYSYLDQLEPAPEELVYRPHKSLFHIPLAVALLIYFLVLVGRLIPFVNQRMFA